MPTWRSEEWLLNNFNNNNSFWETWTFSWLIFTAKFLHDYNGIRMRKIYTWTCNKWYICNWRGIHYGFFCRLPKWWEMVVWKVFIWSRVYAWMLLKRSIRTWISSEKAKRLWQWSSFIKKNLTAWECYGIFLCTNQILNGYFYNVTVLLKL